MSSIKRKYIVDEDNNRIAVQLDIDTFNKMEELLENYALVHLMSETESEEKFELKEAKEYYKDLPKKN